MAIRDAAKEAWMRERFGREDEARAALSSVLAPFDVSALETADAEATDAYTLFVFHDVEDDIHLAARTQGKGWDVHVVADEGVWVMQGPKVESLAHLHELLPAPAPEPEPEPEPVEPTVLPWSQGIYKIGEQASHEGYVWEVELGDGAGNNSWEPGVFGWKKVTV